MKHLLQALLLFSAVFTSVSALAQTSNDPTTWTYEVKPLGGDEYELQFHIALKDGWHIFSQEPGDEFLIPPSFVFDKSAEVKLKDKIEERGTMHTERMDGVDNPINYYEGEAVFVQKVSAKSSLKVTGKHEYQVCNNQMCLPPKKIPFEFSIVK